MKLAPQPFTVLLTLLDRAGALRHARRAAPVVWGDAHHVDFNAGLNFCLAQIRTALGESTTDPTYIATVPRRGYKFIAPVEVCGVADAARRRTGCAHHCTARPRRWARWATLGTGACALAALGLWKPAMFAARAPESSSLAAVTAFERGALDRPTRAPANCARASGSSRRPSATTPSSRAAYAALAEAQVMLAEYRGDEPQRAYAMAKASASVPWRSTRTFPRRTR